MDTRLLKMFCAVAEKGSLSIAAGKLHLTPSAISHGIKGLESQLGCRLFERAGKRMLLNQAGEQLLVQVSPALAALQAAGESLQQLGKWGRARLRVGASASICQHLLPGVICELKRTHAQVELRVESGDTPELVEMLRGNKIDLGLGLALSKKGELETRSIFRDELMFVFAPDHPWAVGRPISREDLRKQPLILYQRASISTRLVDEFFRGLDLVPSAVMEIGSIEAIVELVKLNLGVSVLAPWTVDKELARQQLKMRPLAPKPLARQWVAFSLAGRRWTLVEEQFCKICRQHAQGMRQDRQDITALRKLPKGLPPRAGNGSEATRMPPVG